MVSISFMGEELIFKDKIETLKWAKNLEIYSIPSDNYISEEAIYVVDRGKQHFLLSNRENVGDSELHKEFKEAMVGIICGIIAESSDEVFYKFDIDFFVSRFNRRASLKSLERSIQSTIIGAIKELNIESIQKLKTIIEEELHSREFY